MKNLVGFVSSQTSYFCTFTALCTVFSWTLVGGQPQVTGPLTVRATLGENVTLPCHVEPEYDVYSYTIEWSKPDLKKDPSDPHSGVNLVLLYRLKREITQVKIKSYVGRTSFSPDSLKHGDASLQIQNLTMEDQGRYRCYIPLLKSRVRDAYIELEIDTNVGTTETPIDTRGLSTPGTNDENFVRLGRSHDGIWISIALGVSVLISGVTYLYIHERQKQNNCKNSIPQSNYFVA